MQPHYPQMLCMVHPVISCSLLQGNADVTNWNLKKIITKVLEPQARSACLGSKGVDVSNPSLFYGLYCFLLPGCTGAKRSPSAWPQCSASLQSTLLSSMAHAKSSHNLAMAGHGQSPTVLQARCSGSMGQIQCTGLVFSAVI